MRTLIAAGVFGLAAMAASGPEAAQIEFVAVAPLEVGSCTIANSSICATNFSGEVAAFLNGRVTVADPAKDQSLQIRGADDPNLLAFNVFTNPGLGLVPFTDFYTDTDFANAKAAAGGPLRNNFGLSLDLDYLAPTSPGAQARVSISDFGTLARYSENGTFVLSKATLFSPVWAYEKTGAAGEDDTVVLRTANSAPIEGLARLVSDPVAPAPVPLPASLPLALAGVGLLAWIGRRRGCA